MCVHRGHSLWASQGESNPRYFPFAKLYAFGKKDNTIVALYDKGLCEYIFRAQDLHHLGSYGLTPL